MGARIIKDNLRGILLQDPRVNKDTLWAAESTFGQAGPQPGIPEPQRDMEMVLEASGTQDANKQLRSQCIRGGFPRLGGLGVAWENEGDSLWRGWDAPNVITHYEQLENDVSGGVGTNDQTDIICTKAGTVLIAYRTQTDAAPEHRLKVNRRDRNTGLWTEIAVEDVDLDVDMWPALLELPDGKILCFRWIEDTTALEWNVRAHVSTDDGLTWSVYAAWVLRTGQNSDPGALGFTTHRLKAAYKDGQILLIAAIRSNDGGVVVRDVFVQHASDDLGVSFTRVNVGDRTDATAGGQSQSIVVVGEEFWIFYVLHSNRRSVFRRIGNAYQIMDDQTIEGVDPNNAVEFGTTTTNVFDDSELSAWVDDDGAVYVMGIAFANPGTENGLIARSDGQTVATGGGIFDGLGRNSVVVSNVHWGLWWARPGASDPRPRDISACAGHGRQYVAHTHNNNLATNDASLSVLTLGGWSTVTMPGHQEFPSVSHRVAWENTWLPYDLPGDTSVYARLGTGTDTLLAAGVAIATGAAQALFYRATPPGTYAEGVIAAGQFKVVSGGSAIADKIAIQIVNENGALDSSFSLRFTATQIIYVDNVTAGTLTVSGLDLSENIQVLLATAGTAVAVWYRIQTAATAAFAGDEDREWKLLVIATLGQGPVGAASRVEWGHIATSGGVADSTWSMFNFTSDEWVGLHLASGQVNPDELFWRTITSNPTYISDGTKLAGIDGPGRLGDIHNIDTRHEFPVEDILPAVEPSPRRGWRSIDETQQLIAFQLNPVALETSILQNEVWGLYLGGLNWKIGAMQKRIGGAWSSEATINTAADRSALAFIRTGNRIRVDQTGNDVGQHYIAMNELVGQIVELNPAGNRKLRRVLANSEGYWDGDTTKHPVLLLDGIDGTEDASGNCDIWSDRILVLLHQNLQLTEGFRLRIDAQTGIDGYFEVGTMVFGAVACFGFPYSWGRITTIDANVDLRTAEDGSRSSRVLGPTRRGVQFAWTDGVDITKASGDLPDDDYLQRSGSEPIAARGDAPMLMQGIIDHTSGPHVPVVYIPRVPLDTISDTYTQRDRSLYGRITSAFSIETIQGEEIEDEVVRTGIVEIQEEV